MNIDGRGEKGRLVAVRLRRRAAAPGHWRTAGWGWRRRRSRLIAAELAARIEEAIMPISATDQRYIDGVSDLISRVYEV